MERIKKRRVAHVGQHASKKRCNEFNDLVTDIMKDMDATIAASGNQEIYDVVKSTSRKKDASQSTLNMPSGISNQSNVSSSLPRKFKITKRHSLMEKVRKNINYIKHNRSLPKPRAHLGGLHDSAKGSTKKDSSRFLKSQKKNCITAKIRQNLSNCHTESTHSDESVNDLTSSSSHLLKMQKASCISAKIRQNMSDCHTENNLSDQSGSDVNSKCNKFSVSSSDSESEYESFIRAQKQDTNFDEISNSKCRKKKKLKKNPSSEYKNNVKQNKPAKVEKLKLVELESVENKISRNKHYDIKITAKVSLPNRVQLETSDSSADEKELSGQLFKAGEASSMPSVEIASDEVVPSDQINTSNFMCSVRIERNPCLEKTVSMLKTPLEDCDNEQNSKCSELQGKEIKNFECQEEIVLDEDCVIVCEVAKSNDTCIAESGLNESDIQILNVVSLGERQEVTNGNAISNSPLSSCDRNLGEINFEKLKEAIKLTKVLEGYSNVASFNKETLNPGVHNSNSGFEANVAADSVQNITNCDFKEKVCLSVPKDIIEAVRKIDFKQVLSLTNSERKKESCESPYLSEEKEFSSLPSSSSYSESQPSLMMSRPIPCENDRVIPENHWQNLKKAVSIPGTTSELSEIQLGDDLVKSDINRNLIDKLNTPSHEPSTINSDLNLSYLREIISYVNTTSSRNNNFQDTDRFPLKKAYYEDPCDELDALSATGARDLYQNQSSPTVLKLFSLLNKACQEYSEIEDYERNATMGLKLLEESKKNKIRYLENTITHLLKHDPCLYSTTSKHKDTIVNNRNLVQSSKNEDASSEKIKNCINCGSKSTIECGKCKKVSFCTQECGVYFWNNGHYKECKGCDE